MSDTSARQGVSPTNEPDVCEVEARTITARWNVGQPHGEGWQPQAQLSAHYSRGHGYTTTLTAIEEQRREGIVAVAFQPLAPSVRIHTQPSRRLHRATLARVYDTGLAELRRRFAAGDNAVIAYFTPGSDVWPATA